MTSSIQKLSYTAQGKVYRLCFDAVFYTQISTPWMIRTSDLKALTHSQEQKRATPTEQDDDAAV